MKRLLWARTGKVKEVAKELGIVCKVLKEIQEDIEKEVFVDVISTGEFNIEEQTPQG